MRLPPMDYWILLALISLAVAVGFAVTRPCMDLIGGCDTGIRLEFLKPY